METETTHSTYGAGFMPSWHRPHLRYLVTPDEGGVGADDAVGDDVADDADEPAGAEALGDPGKKALDAMKAERNAARQAERAAKAELAEMQAKQAGKEAEHAAQIEAQRVKDDAISSANTKLKKAELRAVAKGRLADPADALTFIDLDSIDVDDDGNVDTAALEAAVDELVTKKPYLAAQGRRFQGDADGGARTGQRQASQLTEEDVKRMTPEQVDKARRAGQLNQLLGVK